MHGDARSALSLCRTALTTSSSQPMDSLHRALLLKHAARIGIVHSIFAETTMESGYAKLARLEALTSRSRAATWLD